MLVLGVGAVGKFMSTLYQNRLDVYQEYRVERIYQLALIHEHEVGRHR